MKGEALAYAALEFLPAPVFIVNPGRLTVVFVNQAACEFLCYDKHEWTSMSVYDIIHSPAAEALTLNYQSVNASNGISKGVNAFHSSYKRKDGSTFEAETNISRFTAEGESYIVSTIHEVKTKLGEKPGSEQQLHTLVNSIKDHAIYLIDKDARVITWNEGARLLKGYTEEEIIGKSISVFYARADIDNNVIDALLKAAAEKGSIETEGRRVKKDGTVFWANVRLTAIYDEKGDVQAFSKITRDITEEKLFHERVKHFNVELTKKVDHKTAQLTEIFERITDAFMAVDAKLKVTYLNRKAAEMFRLDRDSIVGMPLSRIFPDRAASTIFTRCRAAFVEQSHISCEEYIASFDRWYLGNIYASPEGLSIFFRDVTEKVKALSELEKTELQYRTLVEHASDAILINDGDGHYLDVNTSACQLLGYTKAEILSLHTGDLIAEDHQDSADADKLTGDSDARIREIRLKRKDQTFINVESRVTRLPDGKFLNILRDITQRKKIELKLRESEANLKEAQRLAQLGDWHLDYIKGTLDWSDEVYHIFGVRSDETPTYELFLSRVHPDDREVVREQFEESVRAKSTFDYTYRITLPDGQVKFIHGRGQSFYNDSNEAVRSIGTVQDITESKLAQDSLRKSESRFKRIFESDMVGFIFFNDKGEITEANNRALEIVGYTRADLDSGRINWAQMTPPEYAYLDTVGLQQIAETGVCQPFDKEYIRKDGSRVPITIGAASLDGNRSGVAYVLDNSERKRTESEMVQSRAELRQLAEHLQTIREEERASMAREIHDELGQQLTGLKMDLFWLNKHEKISNDARREKIQGTLSLVDQIIESVGKISSRLRPSILDDLGLIDALQWYSNEFEKRFGIAVKFCTTLAAITVDPKASIALFRIYQESLTNVARHAQARNVVASFGIENNMLRMVISDDGKGLDTGKREPGKKTLGVLGMRERTLMMGGDFQIQSEPGKGTQVSVVVPIR